MWPRPDNVDPIPAFDALDLSHRRQGTQSARDEKMGSTGGAAMQPCGSGGASESARDAQCSILALMPAIDDAAILRRAKELCEAAGMAWDYRDLLAKRGRGSLKGVLDDEARRDYLMRARSQLIAESAAAGSPRNAENN
jgi:hypothetical protein